MNDKKSNGKALVLDFYHIYIDVHPQKLMPMNRNEITLHITSTNFNGIFQLSLQPM